MDKELLTQQLRDEIQDCLHRLTGQLVDELMPIIEAERSPQTYLLEFEIEIQEFTRGFPVGWFVMDRNNCQLLDGPQPQLLTDVTVTIPSEILESAEYKAAGIDTWEVAVEMLTRWFCACWQAAGGEECRYPAYIAMHDEEVSINLNTMEETQYEDKWLE